MRRAVGSFIFTHFVRMLRPCRTHCVRICASISVMMEAKARAADGLDAARALWDDTGLTEGMRDLVREVWTTNLERHEPEELGDSARTLGFLCYENLSARIERRIVGHPLEATRWGIDGLRVARPQGSLRVELASHNYYVMKAPMGAGLQPDWGSLVSWDVETQTRADIAVRNSRSLGGFIASAWGQDELFDHSLPQGAVDSFLFVWAGEIVSGLTAGWLTVPVLGDTPFAAVESLWRDDEGDVYKGARRPSPAGPNFDERESPTPALRLKPRDLGKPVGS